MKNSFVPLQQRRCCVTREWCPERAPKLNEVEKSGAEIPFSAPLRASKPQTGFGEETKPANEEGVLEQERRSLFQVSAGRL